VKKNITFEQPWWYRQVPRDFMSSPDVQIMTAEECGSYFFLLQHAWLGGENATLPNDPDRLAKLARVSKVSEPPKDAEESPQKNRTQGKAFDAGGSGMNTETGFFIYLSTHGPRMGFRCVSYLEV
jgi:hypothetical protein